MAAGDAVGALASVEAEASLTIQPGAGVNWVIHNITSAATSTELYLTDGSNSIKVEAISPAGGWINHVWFLQNNVYLTVKNKGAVAAIIGYTGVQSK